MTSLGRVTAAAAIALILVPPAGAVEPKRVGRAVITFYWTVDESNPWYAGKGSVPLRDARGNTIATTTRRFRTALVMEGSGRLRDGRVVTYNRKVDGEHRFRVTKAKHGLTVTGCGLVPYRTVAVDPKFIRLGSKISIPQLKGAVLPDGSVHDGIFVATDKGHFRGAHVDIFVDGGSKGSRPFALRGYRSRSRVNVYVLDAGTRSCSG